MEKVEKTFLSSFQKTKPTQANRSVAAKRIDQDKKTNIELELIKIVDCFLDGYGSYDGGLVPFEIICS